jgi:hypothetical protein
MLPLPMSSWQWAFFALGRRWDHEPKTAVIHNIESPGEVPLTPTLSPSDGEREKNAITFVVVRRTIAN